MRALLPLALFTVALGAVPAVAQTNAPAAATSLRSGLLLVSADGRRVGRIERIVNDAAGAPVSAAVIVDSRFVYVPVGTISAAEGARVTTSLSRADIRHLP